MGIWLCSLHTNFTTEANIYGPSQEIADLRGISILVNYKIPRVLTCDLFTTRLVDCIFNENHFSALEGDNKFIDDGWKII
jgi:hypothetical protein